MGFEREGFESVAAVEFDSAAAATYALNRPKVPVLMCDIRKVDFKRLSSVVGRPDVVVGGPPCQGFSTQAYSHEALGRGDALRAKRSLFSQAVRAVAESRPAAFLFENVRGLKFRGAHVKIKRLFESLGYRVVFAELDASKFGVPQRRKRVFFCGTKGAALEPPAAGTDSPRTVRAAIGDLPAPSDSGDPLHRPSETTAATLAMIARTRPGDRVRASGGYSCTRLRADEPAPTITSDPKAHPSKNRFLTMRETARLQAIPDSYKFSPTGLKKQIGNMVPPPLASAWARKIKKALSRSRKSDAAEPGPADVRKALETAAELDAELDALSDAELDDWVAKAEEPRGKLPALKMPDPGFNVARLREGETSGVLSRVAREARVDESQALVNEIEPTGADAAFVHAVVTLGAPVPYANLAEVPTKLREGLDEFTLREFAAVRDFFYLPMTLVTEFDPPIELKKPPPGRRFASDVDLERDRVSKRAVPPESLAEFVSSPTDLAPPVLERLPDAALADADEWLHMLFRDLAGGLSGREDIVNAHVFTLAEMSRRGLRHAPPGDELDEETRALAPAVFEAAVAKLAAAAIL